MSPAFGLHTARKDHTNSNLGSHCCVEMSRPKDKGLSVVLLTSRTSIATLPFSTQLFCL